MHTTKILQSMSEFSETLKTVKNNPACTEKHVKYRVILPMRVENIAI